MGKQLDRQRTTYSLQLNTILTVVNNYSKSKLSGDFYGRERGVVFSLLHEPAF